MQPMQLNLLLADLPSGAGSLWEQLDQATRDAVIDALAQAIAKVLTQRHSNQPESNDE
jgi:chorismate-pyruvate lyase